MEETTKGKSSSYLWIAGAVLGVAALSMTAGASLLRGYYTNLSVAVPGQSVSISNTGTGVSVNTLGSSTTVDQSGVSVSTSGGTSVVSTSGGSLSVSAPGGMYVNISRQCQSLFSDVSNSNPYCFAISYLKSRGIVDGYGDGTFKPDRVITRAEAVKIAVNGAGLDISQDRDVASVFTDVALSHTLRPWINYASRVHIVNGYGNGKFGPEDPVTRGQTPKILLNLYGITPVTSTVEYSDVPVTVDLNGYINVAVDNNFVTVSGTTYGINAGMTRGEVAEMMYRIITTRAHNATAFDESFVVNLTDEEADAADVTITATEGGVTFRFKGDWNGPFTPDAISQLAGCPSGTVSFDIEKVGSFTGVAQTTAGATYAGGGTVDANGAMTATWTIGGVLTSFNGTLGDTTGSGTWSAAGCSGTFSIQK